VLPRTPAERGPFLDLVPRRRRQRCASSWAACSTKASSGRRRRSSRRAPRHECSASPRPTPLRGPRTAASATRFLPRPGTFHAPQAGSSGHMLLSDAASSLRPAAWGLRWWRQRDQQSPGHHRGLRGRPSASAARVARAGGAGRLQGSSRPDLALTRGGGRTAQGVSRGSLHSVISSRDPGRPSAVPPDVNALVEEERWTCYAHQASLRRERSSSTALRFRAAASGRQRGPAASGVPSHRRQRARRRCVEGRGRLDDPDDCCRYGEAEKSSFQGRRARRAAPMDPGHALFGPVLFTTKPPGQGTGSVSPSRRVSWRTTPGASR
jgi:hypothetical protein